MQGIEEHVHGALYVDVQGGSLPPKPAANFSVSSDSCEFMWKTVGLEGRGTGRERFACMENIQKMGVRGTGTHQHLLSYHI